MLTSKDRKLLFILVVFSFPLARRKTANSNPQINRFPSKNSKAIVGYNFELHITNRLSSKSDKNIEISCPLLSSSFQIFTEEGVGKPLNIQNHAPKYNSANNTPATTS